MAGSYECFHCLSRGVTWDSDFSFEDYGYGGDGVVHVLHCARCGAEIEYRVPIGGRDDGTEEDGEMGVGERGVAEHGAEAVRGQEGKGDSEVDGRLVDGPRGVGPEHADVVRAGQQGVERPQWWVFTFGCGHPNRGRYVRIFGTLEGTRAEMVRRFGREWAFQYSQEQWDEVIRNLRENGFPHEVEMEVDWDG